jgi:RNA polymerase sigma-70 factor (ECF subfamily)
MQQAMNENSKRTDNELVQLSLQGDRQAFGDLIQRHWRKSVDVACYFLRNRADAEDQAQNAFMKAYEHLDQYQGDAEFSTWLARIVANQCLMLMRVRRRARFVYLDEAASEQKTLPLQLPTSEPDPEGELAYTQLTQVLRSEVKRIPSLMRNVMLLRDIEGLPMADVADQLGITVSAAKSRLVRARAELRTRMNKHYGELRDSSPLAHSAAPLSRVGRHCSLQLAG